MERTNSGIKVSFLSSLNSEIELTMYPILGLVLVEKCRATGRCVRWRLFDQYEQLGASFVFLCFHQPKLTFSPSQGTPVAFFPSTSCNIASKFGPHNIIINCKRLSSPLQLLV
jgi:hypothetical protein